MLLTLLPVNRIRFSVRMITIAITSVVCIINIPIKHVTWSLTYVIFSFPWLMFTNVLTFTLYSFRVISNPVMHLLFLNHALIWSKKVTNHVKDSRSLRVFYIKKQKDQMPHCTACIGVHHLCLWKYHCVRIKFLQSAYDI